ncbi:ankyrin, partial [Terfezia boudieri ATCC MYA-4762]
NRTALHIAAKKGHLEVVKVLLDKGATINAMTHVNRTALHMAAENGHLEVVKVLLDKGATINAT